MESALHTPQSPLDVWEKIEISWPRPGIESQFFGWPACRQLTILVTPHRISHICNSAAHNRNFGCYAIDVVSSCRSPDGLRRLRLAQSSRPRRVGLPNLADEAPRSLITTILHGAIFQTMKSSEIPLCELTSSSSRPSQNSSSDRVWCRLEIELYSVNPFSWSGFCDRMWRVWCLSLGRVSRQVCKPVTYWVTNSKICVYCHLRKHLLWLRPYWTEFYNFCNS